MCDQPFLINILVWLYSEQPDNQFFDTKVLIKHAINSLIILSMCIMYRVDWIEWQANKYCVDDVIWCGFEDELPKFGKINGIIMMMSRIFLTLNLYVTKGIDRHHNSFLVESSTKLLLEPLTEDSAFMGKQHSLKTHSLQSCEPGTFYIVTKYFLSNLS